MTDASCRTPRYRSIRGPLLALAGVRVALGIIAVPLAPFLYEEHFLWLVLLRPTKEVLLAGGFLARSGDVSALPILLAALPFAVFGVWHFYLLGRAYCEELGDANLPGIAGRLLPPERIAKLRDALGDDGRGVLFLGRLSVFPSSLLAAAAGSSEMPRRHFFPVDGAGAVLSIAEVFLAGWLLGEAYDEAGPWLTAAGFVLFAGAAFLFGRRLRASGGGGDDAQGTDEAETTAPPAALAGPLAAPGIPPVAFVGAQGVEP